jgi:hypothetical protein
MIADGYCTFEIFDRRSHADRIDKSGAVLQL